MTTESLDRARAALWRQDGRALQTNEEARNWLEQHPLCLLLPWPEAEPAPAPSFVEASLGEASRTPAPEAVDRSYALLRPLLEAGSAVVLRLGASEGERDFLVEAEILPWVIALAGDREWKQPPQAAGPRQTSQLALDVWKLLKQEGSLTVAEARDRLGGDLTTAAVLHALGELWRLLRVSPLGAPNEARWELMEQHHRQALTAGSAASQVTALSLMVSTYLQSVYAAAEEEIEEFLSPLAARSRIREAVRGLAAIRQVATQTFGSKGLYLLEGTSDLLAAAAPGPQSAEEAREQPSVPAAPEPRRPAVARSVAPAAARAGRPRPGRDRKEPRRGEQRPERREQKSGWRKFSSAPDQEQKQGRGKGWEHPKRRFSGPSRPWLERKEEGRGASDRRTSDRRAGDRGRDAGRRNEGGFGSRRFEDRQDRQPREERQDRPFRGRRDQGGGYANRGGRPGGWTKGRFGRPPEGGDRRRDSPASEFRGGAPGKGPKKRWGGGPKKSWGPGSKKPWGESSQPYSGRPSSRFSDSRSSDSRSEEQGSRGGWRKKPGKSFGSKPGRRFGSKAGKRFGPKPGKRFGSKPGFSRFGSAPKAFRGKKPRKHLPGSPEEPGGE